MTLFDAFIDLLDAIFNLFNPPKSELDALRRINSRQIRNQSRNYGGKK